MLAYICIYTIHGSNGYPLVYQHFFPSKWPWHAMTVLWQSSIFRHTPQINIGGLIYPNIYNIIIYIYISHSIVDIILWLFNIAMVNHRTKWTMASITNCCLYRMGNTHFFTTTVGAPDPRMNGQGWYNLGLRWTFTLLMDTDGEIPFVMTIPGEKSCWIPISPKNGFDWKLWYLKIPWSMTIFHHLSDSKGPNAPWVSDPPFLDQNMVGFIHLPAHGWLIPAISWLRNH